MKVGTIGGGQLAMMLAEAGKKLDIELVSLVDNEDCPASNVATLVIGDQNNIQDVTQFVNHVDVVTFEFENVNLDNLKSLEVNVHPNIYALKIAQDREYEKKCFKQADVPTTDFEIAHSADELKVAIEIVGFPCVIKTCRDGYDGKGQKILRTFGDVKTLFNELGNKRLIVENLVDFDFEVSIIAVRSISGETAFYPLTHNQHQEGILRVSKAPFKNPVLQGKAERYAKQLLQVLNYVGVLAIEFFVKGDDLIANEMAPRVHNSGHWTIEGAKTSQFENHLRAVTNMPLGSTEAVGDVTMINIIGSYDELEPYRDQLNATIHNYHKSARPGRKLAHVTIID